jgi:hypothetical protein
VNVVTGQTLGTALSFNEIQLLQPLAREEQNLHSDSLEKLQRQRICEIYAFMEYPGWEGNIKMDLKYYGMGMWLRIVAGTCEHGNKCKF